jgi:hypothetical protein
VSQILVGFIAQFMCLSMRHRLASTRLSVTLLALP